MQASEVVKNEGKSWKFPPIGVLFILINVVFERISHTGTTNILIVYLHANLGFDQSTATSLFHASDILTFCFPIFGAILADSYLGLFNTICIMISVFAISSTTLALGSVEALQLPSVQLTLIGMFLLITAGSVRSSLATFGADQYNLPAQIHQYEQYYFINMFFVKIGALLGRFIGPVLREDIQCLDMNHCYPLAFGTPAVIMFTGLLIFLCTRSKMIKKPPTGNKFVRVCYCIFYAIFKKVKHMKSEKKHWLDHSVEKFGEELVSATKKILRVFVIFVGISLYWSCFMQQNSRWVYQASQMNGDLGFYTLKPDQIIMLNPLTALIMTPVCKNYVYPLLAKIGVKTLLHRMIIGGFLCIISFIFCIIVEIQIKQNYISMMWLLPQYIFSAISEIFVFISLLNFAYDEAPENMKSVMTALVYLSIAIGIALISIVSGSKIFASQVYEFTFFACCLFVNMIFFIILSSRYKSVKEVKSVVEN